MIAGDAMQRTDQRFTETLRRDGFAVLRQIVPRAVIDDLFRAIGQGLADQAEEWLQAGLITASDFERARGLDSGMPMGLSRRLPALSVQVSGAQLRSVIADAIDRARLHHRVTSAAKAELGPRIVATPQFALRAQCPNRFDTIFPWHQDVFFLDLARKDEAKILNFWIPLVPIDDAVGGIEIIRGSHRFSVLPHGRIQLHEAAPVFQGVLSTALPPGDVVAPLLDVGDAVVLYDKTVHRSVMNRSRRVRWSVDIRYTAAGQPIGRAGSVLAVA